MNEMERENLIAMSRRSFLATTLMALPAAALASNTFATNPEQNWPGFRGPGSQGVAEGFPTRAAWNADAVAGKVSGLLDVVLCHVHVVDARVERRDGVPRVTRRDDEKRVDEHQQRREARADR